MFRAKGLLGFRIWGFGFRVQGLGEVGLDCIGPRVLRGVYIGVFRGKMCTA